MRKLAGAALLALFTFARFAAADDVTISASIDRGTLGLSEQATLQVVVSGSGANIPAPKLPALADFNIYSSGQSQNVSIVNGKMSSSLTYNYVLSPKAAGKFTIPPVTLDYNGKAYQTAPIAVEVTQQSAAPQPAQGGAAPQAAPADDAKNIFVEASADKSTVYVNQQLTYYFRLYNRLRLAANPEYYPSSFSGFWTENLPPKNYKTSVGGTQYGATELGTMLFPAKPGKFTIGPARLRCKVIVINPNDPFSDEFFQAFTGGGKVIDLETKPLSITVLPLPEDGKPKDFNGTVGSYSISASLDRNSVKTNEPVTLSVTVSGTGNIKTVQEPRLSDLPDFRKYETVSSLNLDNATGVMKGSKTFKTVLVPATQGQKTIPPVTFSFFDPAAKAYRSLSTRALSLTVKQGEAVPSTALPSSGVKVMNTDIRYIKTPAKWPGIPRSFFGTPLFIALNAVPLLALGAVFGYRRWEDALSGDTAFARRLKASPAARKYLKQAKKLLASGSPGCEALYSAVSRALAEYIAHKFNVSPDGLVSASVEEMLASRKVPAETIADVKDVLEECDMARFAPTQATREMMETAYAKTAETIGKLEKYL